MTFTDKEAKRLFNSIKCYECKESIASYPEDERDGRSDKDILREEIEYFVYLFEEVDGALSGDLEEALEIKRRTKNYRVMPVYLPSMKPVYKEWDIQRSKNTIAEYRQLKRLLTKL